MRSSGTLKFLLSVSWVLLGIVGGLWAISLADNQPPRLVSHEQTRTLSKPLLKFGGQLLRALTKSDAKSNLIFSPISMHQALSMLMIGADQASETREEIQNAIGYSGLSEAAIVNNHQAYARLMGEFSKITSQTRKQRCEAQSCDVTKPDSLILNMFTMMVTKDCGQPKFDYAHTISSYFNSSIATISDNIPETKTRLIKAMNDWGKRVGIKSPIITGEYLRGEFEALLVAAISVEAFWFESFSECSGTFNNFGFKSQRVRAKFLKNSDLHKTNYIEFTSIGLAKFKTLNQIMSKDGTFKKLSRFNFQAGKVGLKGDLNLIILEPLNGETNFGPNDKLNKLTDDLVSSYPGTSATYLDKALELLDRDSLGQGFDELIFPEFNFEGDQSPDLKPSLYSMGIKRAFDRSLSELSQMTDKSLFLGDVRHKAVIKMAKEGAKAAGHLYSLGVAIGGSKPKEPSEEERINVIIENPFIFLLRYKNIPLFMGRLSSLPETETD